jgi:hypothetical protein
VLYWYSRCGQLVRILLSFFAALWLEAFKLLTTILMGMLGLCSFSRMFSVGGVGLF